MTNEPFYRLPLGDGNQRYVYVVTALNRLQNESKGAKINVTVNK